MQYDFTFDEIRFYVSHLMKWQKPVIINALSRFSTFTLDPKYYFKASDTENFPEKYKNEYSDLITRFEDPKILRYHTQPNGQNIETGLIIKLLQIDMLKECNTYVYLKGNKDNKMDKLYQKDIDFGVYNTLKKYSMKNCHIHEISWKEDISLADIINILKTSDTFGSYYI